MDLTIKMSFLALMMICALTKVSAQSVQCYSCTYTYYDGENEDDSENCKNPTTDSTATIPATSETACTTATRSCAVRTTFSASSSVPNVGAITYSRTCVNKDTDCHDDCKKNARDCTKCCTGERCNIATFESHLSDNALVQTCHKCQYSEVLGTRSDTGCGLSFDATSSGVYEVMCPGLCFSAKAKFEHVEDIIRGCSYYGNECDYHDSYDTARQITGRDSVTYDIACCKGDKCNTATTISAGVLALLFSTLLGAVVTHL